MDTINARHAPPHRSRGISTGRTASSERRTVDDAPRCRAWTKPASAARVCPTAGYSG